MGYQRYYQSNKNVTFEFAIKDKTKNLFLFKNTEICSKKLYFKQVVNINTKSKMLWKIINNIITTSHSKINGVLDVQGKFVDEPK